MLGFGLGIGLWLFFDISISLARLGQLDAPEPLHPYKRIFLTWIQVS